MRRYAALALVLLLATVPALQAQLYPYKSGTTSASGVNPSNLTSVPLINPGQSMYTTTASNGGVGLTGFSPANFFRSIGNFFQPPQYGNSVTGTMVSGPNPYPTTLFPFPKTNVGVPTSSIQLPSCQVQTSFQN